ncbi:flagellar hook-associated protein FlgK [Pusillimonas sp. DMV24BSW_D]|uniref:Flagellar hook-associated protein 1 n=1 Tax=Neopusillimonas maritima TaxID=2026239 RepID=A0A3A1YNT7_9BURK|nr:MULTISPECIES: flagellar hook-associated protein FlgK [Alcaligenaceae]QIM49245.1 flagellar hook-associated protein FlgK [Pusillimonas sp. DMV24BSW_D]RIY39933.1 flagellar hook-associated protein FlgK [Neopusillimonas maritima]
MNLSNLGLSGIQAAQNRLQTTGHNINNAATEGYNRQSVKVSTAGAQATGAGYVGLGVQVDTIDRAYNNFLYRQLVDSQSKGAELGAYGTEITQVNNIMADRTVGISPALQKFFDGMQAVASSPADPAARQELLGRASSLVGQLNDTNAFLNDQRSNINTQVNTVVRQINSYVERVHDLNNQIVTAKAAGSGHAPNDLLDKRDQAVAELNELVGVNVIEQGDRFGLSFGRGQVLLSSDTVYPLQAGPSIDDPSRTVVSYAMPAGNGKTTMTEIGDQYIRGGKLGGLLQYRSQTLDAVQNDLGRLATGLAMAVNAQHEQGFDQVGRPGEAFFSLPDPSVSASERNQGNGEFSASFVNANDLTASDYQISYNGANYSIVRQPDGNLMYEGTTFPVTIDGIEMDFSGTALAGDRWTMTPTRGSASDIKLNISNPASIAAAGSDAGDADNGNALKLAQLQTDKVLGNGTMSLNESFSQIVNTIGVQTQQNQTAQKAQDTLVQQNFAAQQAISGVNLNEEYVNLERYQEHFRAASRLIDVSSTLFDTLLSLRQ